MAPFFLNSILGGIAATAFVSSPSCSQANTNICHRWQTDLSNNAKAATPTEDDLHSKEGNDVLNQLISDLGGSPSHLLRLFTTPEGVRGVYLNEAVKEGDILLKIPLSSCLRDDDPPAWLIQQQEGNDDSDDDLVDVQTVQIQGWVTHLAASLLETQKQNQNKKLSKGLEKWLKLLPSSLKDSLPVYWDESTLQSTQCRHLEMAVDSAFFARAGPLADLAASNMTREEIERALDLVQTRACRCSPRHREGSSSLDSSEKEDVRVLVPVFDMINHNYDNNAEFYMEGEYMVVSALRDIDANTEICISYGSSTIPVWRCLFSYGFVPCVDDIYEHNVADMVTEEGYRFEVSPAEIPFELIQYHAQKNMQKSGSIIDEKGDLENYVEFTPEIGHAIVQQLTMNAKALEGANNNEEESQDDDGKSSLSPVTIQLVNSLRESHRRTFLACAGGLREFLEEQQ